MKLDELSEALLPFFHADVIINSVEKAERARSRLSIGIWTVFEFSAIQQFENHSTS